MYPSSTCITTPTSYLIDAEDTTNSWAFSVTSIYDTVIQNTFLGFFLEGNIDTETFWQNIVQLVA